VNNHATVRPLVLAASEGEALWFGPNRMTVKASAADTGGAYGLLHSVVPPGSAPPLHLHRTADEAFYVLRGELRIVCGDEEIHAGPGHFTLLPRGVPHTFIALSETEVLTLLSPGGSERYFADAGGPAAGPGLPPLVPPDIPRLREAGGKYDIEIVGPPLAAG
jgi:mannose-6-phosphate isomerase-like protein (cupin superfamily)